ncbi:MAG: glutamine amidotransferase [Sandaracinaceae bacterium]|nr:glutamine amidotransferase [Sandaracinaceae bacterium]
MGGITLDVPGGLVTALVLALALGAAAVLSLRALAGVPASRRVWLTALRVLTALGAWLVAVQPAWTEERSDDEPGRLAVLLDVSRSMRVGADRAEDQARIARARALLPRWRTEAGERGVSLAAFGRTARARSFDEPEASFVAVDDDARLGEAIEDAAEDATAVVVVSDGADLAGGAVESAEASGVRVHAVFVGDPSALVDDAIAHVDYDRVGFVRRPVRIRAELRSYGQPAHVVALSLYEGETLARELRVELPENGTAHVELEVTPPAIGRALYRLALPHMAADMVRENDERALLVRVQRDDLRALLVAGRPSWDQRFLRSFLKRDPTTDLISFFILRNTADMTMADSEDLALIPFPTDELFNEHLGSFDVVIFQNFDYAPYQMEVYLPRIREYVERGGSFAMIGGPLSFSQAGYAETPVGEVLPVEVLPARTPESRALTTDEFHPRIADAARFHPLVQLASDARANELAWGELAPLQGLNVVARLQNHGQRVLEHPSLRDDDAQPLPVLATCTFGRGRVLALMTDTSWRWGMTTAGETGDATAYERFWDTTLRWLARDPLLDPARVTTDRERYGPEAPLRVEATLRDLGYQPFADEHMQLRVLDAAGREVRSVEARTDASGQLAAEVEPPAEPGGYRVIAERRDASDGRVSSRPSAGVIEHPRELAEEVFVVELGGDELADPRPAEATLRTLAERTGGRFTTLEEAGALADFDASRSRVREVVRRRPFASAPAVLALLVLFGVEWILRRRWVG